MPAIVHDYPEIAKRLRGDDWWQAKKPDVAKTEALMSTTKIERTLDYTRIIGPGVDALDRRKEHNNNEQVTAEKLRENIAKVKDGLAEGLKMLRAGATGKMINTAGRFPP